MSFNNTNNNNVLSFIKEEKLDRLDLDEINITNNETNSNSNDAFDFNENIDYNSINSALVEDIRTNLEVYT